MKESAIPVRAMERYVELHGKQVSRSTLHNSVFENVEGLVVLPARDLRSVVFFRDTTIAALKMLKDDDDNLEAALDVVATTSTNNVLCWSTTVGLNEHLQ